MTYQRYQAGATHRQGQACERPVSVYLPDHTQLHILACVIGKVSYSTDTVPYICLDAKASTSCNPHELFCFFCFKILIAAISSTPSNRNNWCTLSGVDPLSPRKYLYEITRLVPQPHPFSYPAIRMTWISRFSAVPCTRLIGIGLFDYIIQH